MGPTTAFSTLSVPKVRARSSFAALMDRQPGGPSSIAAPRAWHPVGMPFPAALPGEVAADPWLLRLLSDADWKLAWTMSRDPDVVRWTLHPPEMTEEAARRRSRRITESANQCLSGHYAVLDPDNAAIGTAGIASNEGDANDAEVFYALLPEGRHRGAATAVTIALSEWAFSTGVERVLLLTISGNTASEAVARRAAFLPDGEEIRDHRGSPTSMRRWARTSRT